MNWKTIAGILISALFLYLAFRKVDIDELRAAFQAAKYHYAVPAALLLLLSLFLRTIRWKYFLMPVKNMPIKSLYVATMIGFMANNLLPARLGEFVRAYAIGEKEKVSKSASLATIVVERVFDGFTILFLLAIIVVFHSFTFPVWLKQAAYITLAFYVLALLFLILLKLKTGTAISIAEAVLRPFPDRFKRPFIRLLDSFITGLHSLHDVKNVLISSFLSLLIWLPHIAIIHITLISIGIVLPVSASMVLLVALAIGVMVPSAPGFIGTVQFVCVAVLSLFGVSSSQSLSFSVIYHVIIFVPVTVIGLIFLAAEGFSFGDIRRSMDDTVKTVNDGSERN
jgi:uncharacterized protein (TIRG00374 family)